MSAQFLFSIIILFIVVEFAVSKILDILNLKNLQSSIPKEAEGIYDAEKYRRSQEYLRVNTRFGFITSSFSVILILGMLFFDGFAYLDTWLRENVSENPIVLGVSFFAVLFVAQDVISLPFSLYRTFVIEEKFGFNRTSPKTFITDKIKGYLLAAVIGGGLLAGLVYLYQLTGSDFWWIGWIVASLFSIFMAMLYTSWIIPIFNKLTPLEDGSLLDSIKKYASHVNFPLKEISIMDSSKRSSKANAFFSGLGPKKSIVLFDTLVKEHSKDEITAVLAHEVGHYKKKHVLQGVVISVLQMGVLFFLFGWLSSNPVLSEVLGAEKNSFHLSLIAFSLLYSPVSLITGIGMNMYSRKNEYEADEFARETYGPQPLISALKKLASNNLSNLTPHPAYAFFHYSHPPLLKRLSALKAKA